MLIGILQPRYMPWLGFFEQMARVDAFVLYDDVQYDKQGWRNRNRIKNSQGIQWLSVPILTKGKRRQLINQARIDPTNKRDLKHLASLETNYKKAIYFDADFAICGNDGISKQKGWMHYKQEFDIKKNRLNVVLFVVYGGFTLGNFVLNRLGIL